MRLHIGTEEVLGRIFFVEKGRKKCEAGESTVALVRLEQEVAAAVDDSFILRFYSPAETIGGGTVVDPAPPVRLKAARPWLAGLVNKSSDERLEKFLNRPLPNRSPYRSGRGGGRCPWKNSRKIVAI